MICDDLLDENVEEEMNGVQISGKEKSVIFNFLGQLSSPLGPYAMKFVAAILRELVKAQVRFLARRVAHFVSTRLINR